MEFLKRRVRFRSRVPRSAGKDKSLEETCLRCSRAALSVDRISVLCELEMEENVDYISVMKEFSGCASTLTTITANKARGTAGKLIQTSHPVDPVPSMESLSFDLRRLLDDRTHSDVTLKCEDHTIAAHRAILSARSEVFSAMLRSDMSESRDGVITVIDIEAPILEQLVQYIYSGSIPELSANTAQRLYEAADKYAIESLKTQCSDFMKENLTKENAWNVLVLADAHFDEDLKEQAISFIVRTHLLMDDTWAEFRVDYPLLAKEVDSLADPVICSSRQSGRYQHSN